MGDLPATLFLAAVLGLVAGVVVVRLGFSALRGFISIYGVALVVFMLVYVSQAPFMLAMLGTLAVAVFSFVPATGGFVAGAWLARATLRQKSEASENAP